MNARNSWETADEFHHEPAAPRLIEQASRVHHELQQLQQQALATLDASKEADTDDFQLTWAATMTVDDLVEAAMNQARAAVEAPPAVQPGHVYCYRCGSPDCEHSQPPGVGDVFAGYENTGQPRWLEFFNCLLAWNDDRVDKVFGDRPQLLARMAGRRRLIDEQFVSHGRNSMTYRILGQVIAGYFKVRGERGALSVQVVENAKRELHVQLIAPNLIQEAFVDTPENRHSAFSRIYHGLRQFRRRIQDLAPDWQRAKGGKQRQKQLDRIFAQMRHLMNSIERKGRQSRRRTRHAQVRSEQKRPVHKACDDAAAAALTDLYRDRKHQSIIVVGRRGRAHVFNDDGKHVTSLSMPADKLERRVKRKRYVQLPQKDAKGFLSTLTTDE